MIMIKTKSERIRNMTFILLMIEQTEHFIPSASSTVSHDLSVSHFD